MGCSSLASGRNQFGKIAKLLVNSLLNCPNLILDHDEMFEQILKASSDISERVNLCGSIGFAPVLSACLSEVVDLHSKRI